MKCDGPQHAVQDARELSQMDSDLAGEGRLMVQSLDLAELAGWSGYPVAIRSIWMVSGEGGLGPRRLADGSFYSAIIGQFYPGVDSSTLNMK